jgi:ParB/RepB/Spo0J family partition protein
MARSLERYGQLSPVVVCQRQQRYELIDGFKRLGAARTAHISHLSARLLEADERTAKAAIYGLNRAGGRTRELEEAWIIQPLVREDGMSQVEVAELLGRHKSWVCRRLALIERLGPKAKDDLRVGLLSPTAARQVVRLPEGNRAEVLEAIRRARRCPPQSWAAWWICGCDAPSDASSSTCCSIRAKRYRRPRERSRRCAICD